LWRLVIQKEAMRLLREMEKQGMKVIYFNNRYELNINEVNEKAGQTLLFTSIEEFVKLKETHLELMVRLGKTDELQTILRIAASKGLISKRLAKELEGLI
jgi:arginine deiminase